MIDDLTKPNGRCALATAGITISSERQARGIAFSYPTYRWGCGGGQGAGGRGGEP